MALSKEIVINKTEVVKNGIVQVRQVTLVMEDGQQLFSSCSFTLDTCACLLPQMTTK